MSAALFGALSAGQAVSGITNAVGGIVQASFQRDTTNRQIDSNERIAGVQADLERANIAQQGEFFRGMIGERRFEFTGQRDEARHEFDSRQDTLNTIVHAALGGTIMSNEVSGASAVSHAVSPHLVSNGVYVQPLVDRKVVDSATMAANRARNVAAASEVGIQNPDHLTISAGPANVVSGNVSSYGKNRGQGGGSNLAPDGTAALTSAGLMFDSNAVRRGQALESNVSNDIIDGRQDRLAMDYGQHLASLPALAASTGVNQGTLDVALAMARNNN